MLTATPTQPATATQEQQQPSSPSPTVKDVLVVWYDEHDLAVMKPLDPHLQIVARQFGLRLAYWYFPERIPTPPGEYSLGTSWKQYVADYQAALGYLERAVLFVPCLSPWLVVNLWGSIVTDPKLAAIVKTSQFKVKPVVLRALNATSRIIPLANYAEGSALDLACARLAAEIGAALSEQGHEAVAPPTLFTVEEPLALEGTSSVVPVSAKKKRFKIFIGWE